MPVGYVYSTRQSFAPYYDVMETLSALLALCWGNLAVTGGSLTTKGQQRGLWRSLMFVLTDYWMNSPNSPKWFETTLRWFEFALMRLQNKLHNSNMAAHFPLQWCRRHWHISGCVVRNSRIWRCSRPNICLHDRHTIQEFKTRRSVLAWKS